MQIALPELADENSMALSPINPIGCPMDYGWERETWARNELGGQAIRREEGVQAACLLAQGLRQTRSETAQAVAHTQVVTEGIVGQVQREIQQLRELVNEQAVLHANEVQKLHQQHLAQTESLMASLANLNQQNQATQSALRAQFSEQHSFVKEQARRVPEVIFWASANLARNTSVSEQNLVDVAMRWPTGCWLEKRSAGYQRVVRSSRGRKV